EYGVIKPGDTYTGTFSYRIPFTTSGTFYLIAVTDDLVNSIYEGTGENNNSRVSAPFTITQSPAPDLKITTVSANPASAQSGQFVDVTYTVINNGTGATDVG